MSEISSELARFTSQLTLSAIPAPVRERAKLLISDSVAVAIRGSRDVASTEVHLRGLEAMEQGGSVSVIGSHHKLSAPAAAEINAALIHSLDFDDTYAPGALHPSATVLPAALAVAQREGLGGADVLVAVISGYEAVCRLAVALGSADHYDRGFHPTATCGAFGAALAAARVLGLDQEQNLFALGIALSQTAGSLQFLDNGAWTKRFQVGNAARAGVVSAYLAREGYIGAARPLEGKHGFLKAYAPNAREEKVITGLGVQWRTLGIAIKPYPACRFAHAAVDALIELRAEHDLRSEDVDSVWCGLPRKGLLLVGEPIEQKRRVTTVVEGQFSMPFAAAVVLLDGRLTWDSYARWLGKPEVAALMQKVDAGSDPEVESLFPERFGARIEVRLKDGQVLRRLVESPRGEPDNFVSVDELGAKFHGLVQPYVDVARSERLLRLLLALEEVSEVADLFDLMVPAA